jgi:hypothetical protein
LRKKTMLAVTNALYKTAPVLLLSLVLGVGACGNENDLRPTDASVRDTSADSGVTDLDTSIVGDAGFDGTNQSTDTVLGADASPESIDSEPIVLELHETGPTDGGVSEPETSWEPPLCPYDDPSDYAEVNIQVTVVAEETGEPVSAETVEWYYRHEAERDPSVRAEIFLAESVNTEGSVWHITAPACGGIYVTASYLQVSDSVHCWWNGFDTIFIEADPTTMQQITLRPATTLMGCISSND